MLQLKNQVQLNHINTFSFSYIVLAFIINLLAQDMAHGWHFSLIPMTIFLLPFWFSLVVCYWLLFDIVQTRKLILSSAVALGIYVLLVHLCTSIGSSAILLQKAYLHVFLHITDFYIFYILYALFIQLGLVSALAYMKQLMGKGWIVFGFLACFIATLVYWLGMAIILSYLCEVPLQIYFHDPGMQILTIFLVSIVSVMVMFGITYIYIFLKLISREWL
jgi:hypothetical protein